jgi:hypothetical protein
LLNLQDNLYRGANPMDDLFRPKGNQEAI